MHGDRPVPGQRAPGGSVHGGGALHGHGQHPQVDPTLAALTTLLVGSQPTTPQGPPALERVLGLLRSLGSLLGGDRGAGVSQEGGPATPQPEAAPGAADPAASLLAAVQGQPARPDDDSLLTLDPSLLRPGTEGDEAGLGAAVGAREPAGPRGVAEGDDERPAMPSSWLPIVGPGLGRSGGDAAGAGDPTGRVRELLDRLGITRMQLLALAFLAPLAATVLLAVVSRIIDGG